MSILEVYIVNGRSDELVIDRILVTNISIYLQQQVTLCFYYHYLTQPFLQSLRARAWLNIIRAIETSTRAAPRY